jgi:flagellar motility protein MotE (MotC chaperone)
VKKVIIIAGALGVSALLFLVSFVGFAKARGGIASPAAAKVPLLGGLLKAPASSEAAPAAGQPQDAQAQTSPPLPGGREVPFLRFGPEAKLQRLTQELDAKRTEYETALRDAQRRSRELDAWERQLKEERDSLREAFDKEKQELTQLQGQLAAKESELAQRQVIVQQSEEANLKKTAEIYGKMTPERAAQVLTQMYNAGQQDTVVKIIYLMQDRSAAKTLEAITDAKVGAQITEKLKQVGKTTQQGA